jgi:hypothetical protein
MVLETLHAKICGSLPEWISLTSKAANKFALQIDPPLLPDTSNTMYEQLNRCIMSIIALTLLTQFCSRSARGLKL